MEEGTLDRTTRDNELLTKHRVLGRVHHGVTDTVVETRERFVVEEEQDQVASPSWSRVTRNVRASGVSQSRAPMS